MVERDPDGAPAAGAARTGWVLVDGDDAARSLGGVLAWADRQSLDTLHLIADDAGVLARRATQFRSAPQVWQVRGATVVAAEPSPVPAVAPPPAEALDLVSHLTDAGVDIVIEHGEVRGEILGLEMARIVVVDGVARIEVGVGRHDREAFAMVHGDIPTADALDVVVTSVRRHRGPGREAGQFPLGRMAAEQWLRRVVVADPSLVGASELSPAEPVLPRESLNDISPAVAVGRDADGEPLVVVCSTGIDLDLVPAAADARLLHAPQARLRLVVPERDNHRVTQRLAASLVAPADVVPFAGDFREMTTLTS